MSHKIDRKITRLIYWLKLRNIRYIIIRLLSLLQRYGITSTRAKKRTVECIKLLARYNCHPTFPIPGRVVSRHAEFCRDLQGMGVEFAVHGYDHVDLRSLSDTEAKCQFIRASDAFYHSGIQLDGFRCPYLSYTPALVDVMPQGVFKYSSNKAIWWNVIAPESMNKRTAIFESLRKFYQAEDAESIVATPHISGDLLEIPASLPDDLQLYDGLKLRDEDIRQVWNKILQRTHGRGELFVLLFHPESYQYCKLAFEHVLSEAKLLQPTVWVTQLRDVSRWWWEKSSFVANVCTDSSGLHISFDCSERATVLMRDIETSEPRRPWDGSYQVLESRTLHLSADQRPFVGVPPDIPAETKAFVEEQGYIIDRSEHAAGCTVYLDSELLAQYNTQVQLINYIECLPGPLVRFWRWPNEAKSALCVTGDLDALSLIDYASRLFTI
jgi:peptidoglycan/xylan/chitin deacetylase (PgdA/CDA1 family)